MKDLESGKPAPRHGHGKRRPLYSHRTLVLCALIVAGGVFWIYELHTLLWYTMNCEYLSHRDARFVNKHNNYLCLTDIELSHALRALAFTAATAFEAHNITYFLESGTLLGSYREQGVIRHDTDVDLGIDAAGLDYLRTHPVELPDGYVLNVWNSPLFPGSTRDDKLPVRITHKATALYVDVFAFLDWPDHALWGADAVGPLPSICFKGCKACPKVGKFKQFTVPRAWVYPLVDCPFEGRTLKCPRESAKYLEHMFGKDYMIPS